MRYVILESTEASWGATVTGARQRELLSTLFLQISVESFNREVLDSLTTA